eukprot:459218-Rhodomonas_salina.1
MKRELDSIAGARQADAAVLLSCCGCLNVRYGGGVSSGGKDKKSCVGGQWQRREQRSALRLAARSEQAPSFQVLVSLRSLPLQ